MLTEHGSMGWRNTFLPIHANLTMPHYSKCSKHLLWTTGSMILTALWYADGAVTCLTKCYVLLLIRSFLTLICRVGSAQVSYLSWMNTVQGTVCAAVIDISATCQTFLIEQRTMSWSTPPSSILVLLFAQVMCTEIGKRHISLQRTHSECITCLDICAV